jgi:hypothetical protein
MGLSGICKRQGVTQRPAKDAGMREQIGQHELVDPRQLVELEGRRGIAGRDGVYQCRGHVIVIRQDHVAPEDHIR